MYLPCTDWFGTANGRCSFAVTNQSENGKYNLISVWFNKISKRFLCVCGAIFCKKVFLAWLTRVTSPPRRFPSYLLFSLHLYFLFIFYLPGIACWMLLLCLLRLPRHFYRVVIEQQLYALQRVSAVANDENFLHSTLKLFEKFFNLFINA